MTYDAIVDWSSLSALILFVSMSVFITWRVFQPGRRAEMDRMARIPLDKE